MKKILCSMFIAVLMLLGATNCLAEEQNTYLIYRNQNFDDHRIGDKPGAFLWHQFGSYAYADEEAQYNASYGNTEIVELAKDGNTANRAVKFNDFPATDFPVRNKQYTGVARSVFSYYPMKENGVISFSLLVDNPTDTKTVDIKRNVTTYRTVNYADNERYDTVAAYFNLITIKDDKIYYNKTTELGDVSPGVWYDIDFVFDVTAGTGTIYLNDTPTSVSLPDGTVNIYEVCFNLPTAADDALYIDDYRVYEADTLVDDSVIDAQWNAYADSLFYTGYEFESGRAANYDYMAFLKCDGKRFTIIDTGRFFDGSKLLDMDATIHYNDAGILMAPAYDMAKALGATVAIGDDNSVSVTYGGKTMVVTFGTADYLVDGKPAKLLCPVDDDGRMQADVLFAFLGQDYTIHDDILWFDQPAEFDWHMPIIDGVELTATSGYSIEENIYQRTLRMALYDRPTDEEIDSAMSSAHPRIEFTAESVADIKANMATDAELKSFVDKIIVENYKDKYTSADELLFAEKVPVYKKAVDEEGNPVVDADGNPVYEQAVDEEGNPVVDADGNPVYVQLYYSDGEPVYESDYTYGTSDGKRIDFSGVGEVIEKLAFGYLMSDDTDKKAQYKDEISHHLSYMKDPDAFPDWGIDNNNGLGTGSMAYGFAHVIDWVVWTEEEMAALEEMCKRNILDPALHAYNCTLSYYHHGINYGEGNQALITNGGILMLATALYERDPDYYSDVIRGALRATEGGTIVYFPNGEYAEGVSYWRYASTHLASVLTGLQTSMGTDWGITDIPGVLKTGYFPFMMKGSTESHAFAFGDGDTEKGDSRLMMFVANQTGDKVLAQYRKTHQQSDGKSISDIANWVYDTEGYTREYPDDAYNEGSSTVVMKSGTQTTDTTVAFHGGANNDPHGHWDIGSFQFDMNGERFGIDLERENYNLRDKGHKNVNKVTENYPKDRFPNGYPFTGGHYYRQKGEGHNTVVANRSVINAVDLYDDVVVETITETTDETTGEITTETTPKTISVFDYTVDRSKTYDMNGSAKSEFTEIEFGDEISYAVLNMTETNDIFNCAIRGIKLDKVNNIIYIQDDFAASSATDFLWSMHTGAELAVSDDGKSAILTSSSGKQIKATIINGSDYTFEIMAAEFDTTYGSDIKPLVETSNGTGCTGSASKTCDASGHYHKLAVRTPVGENITRFRLAVAIEPYVEGDTSVAEYAPIETWKNN